MISLLSDSMDKYGSTRLGTYVVFSISKKTYPINCTTNVFPKLFWSNVPRHWFNNGVFTQVSSSIRTSDHKKGKVTQPRYWLYKFYTFMTKSDPWLVSLFYVLMCAPSGHTYIRTTWSRNHSKRNFTPQYVTDSPKKEGSGLITQYSEYLSYSSVKNFGS